jgi:membrane protein
MKKFTEQLKKLLYPDEEAVATKDSETARLGRAVRRWAAQAYRFMTTVGKVFSKDRCFQIGAVLTYVTLLSIFPLVAVLLFLVPVFFSAEQTRMEVGEFILKGLIPSTGEWFDKQLESYFQVFHEKAAGIGAMGLVFLFLMAVIMFVVVERSFNEIWKAGRRRSVLKAFAVFSGVIIWIPLCIGASYYLTRKLAAGTGGGWGSNLTSYLPFLLTFVGLTLANLYVPNTRVRLSSALLGALVAATLWEVAKANFGTYIGKYGTYTTLFRAVGAIPYLLVWVYVSWLIILIGVVIAYCSQNFRALLIEDISKSFDLIDSSVVLALLYVVGDYFVQGRGGVAVADLQNYCPLKADDLQTHLGYLEQQGYVYFQPEEESYILKKPPGQIRLRELLRFKDKIEGVLFYQSDAKRRLLARLSDLDATLDQLLKDQTLEELLGKPSAHESS